MKIGDKVRFLNDVGGGKITAFRPGGIVLVEDADGFDVPMPQNEVVVIEEKTPSQPLIHHGEEGYTIRKSVGGNKSNGAPYHHEEEGYTIRKSVGGNKSNGAPYHHEEEGHTIRKSVGGNKSNGAPYHHEEEGRKDKENLTLNGKDYLKSKTVIPAEEEDEVDENLEARIVRLEMTLQQQTLTIQKLEARIALLEAENNLHKNEKLMAKQAKQPKKPEPPTNIEGLQIL